MKGNTRPSHYFSAYPLKALDQEVSAPSSPNHSSPYLKSVLSGKTRIVSRVRILPMINPYRPSVKLVSDESKLPKDIEMTEKEWFNNYE